MFLISLKRLFAEIKEWLCRLLKAGVTIYSRGDRNQNLAIRDISAEKVNIQLGSELSRPLPEVLFKLPAPFNRPEQFKYFTGREAEIDRMVELLLNFPVSGRNNVVAIYGMPGVGKSALACYFATRYSEQFPGGVYGIRVDRAGEDLRDIARRFANRCGEILPPEDERDPQTIMQNLFAEDRVLLVFDNADRADIRSLFPSGTELAIVITTRSSDLPHSLDLPPERQIQLTSLQEQTSIELLEKIVGENRIRSELDVAKQIARCVGYLPLALQVVGATLKTSFWTQKTKKLADYAEALNSETFEILRREEDPDNLDVRASFALSLKTLSEDGATFFACLGACAADSFSFETARVTAGCSEIQTNRHLASLTGRSLVDFAETSDDRYTLHALIYQFAKEILAKQPERQREAEARHANYFVELVGNSDLEDGEVLARLDRDVEDLFLTAAWLRDRESPNYNFILRLESFFEQYGYWQEAICWIVEFRKVAECCQDWESLVELGTQQVEYLLLGGGQVLQAKKLLNALPQAIERVECPSRQKRCEAMRLRSLASWFQRRRRLREAEEALRDSEKLFESLGEQDRDKQARILNKLGTVLRSQEHFGEAAKVFKRSLNLYRVLNNQRGEAKVLTSLGALYNQQGDFGLALKMLKDSCAIAEALDDRRGLAIVFKNLGNTYQLLGRFGDAKAAFCQSYKLWKQLNNHYSVTIALMEWLKLLQIQNRLEDAFALAGELNEPKAVAIALTKLAEKLRKEGQFDAATEAVYQGIKVAERYSDRRQQAIGWNVLGNIARDRGNDKDAEEFFRDSVAIAEELGDPLQLIISFRALGQLLQQQGNYKDAEKFLRDSVAHAEELDNPYNLVISLNALGGVLQQQRNDPEAAKVLDRSVKISKTLNNPRQFAISLNALGMFLKQQGNHPKAIELLRSAVEIDEENFNYESLVISLNNLAELLQVVGDPGEAEKMLERSIAIDEELNRHESLVKSLNNLSTLRRRQKKLLEAKKTLYCAIEICEYAENWKGLAITLNNLITILQQEELWKEAIPFLERCAEMDRRLENDENLARTLTRLGKAYIRQRNWKDAASALEEAFEIEIKAKNEKVLESITPSLCDILKKLEDFKKMKNVYDRAIAIAPNNKKLQELSSKMLAKPKETIVARGIIKRNYKPGGEYGFIFSQDLNDDIFFHESHIDPDVFTKLKPGLNVEVEAIYLPDKKNPVTVSLRILDSSPVVRKKQRSNRSKRVTGSVKRLLKFERGNFYGFIAPDNGSPDIYFHESQIDPEIFHQLKKGDRVEVEVRYNDAKGAFAKRIRILN